MPPHRLREARSFRARRRRRSRCRHPRQRPVVMGGQLFADHACLHPLRHHVGRAGRQAELTQVVVGRLLHREHTPHQSAELDRVVDVRGDDRLRRAGADHPSELKRALLVALAVAAMLQHQVEPEPLPTPKGGNCRQRSERVDLDRGQGSGSHNFLHRVGDRHHVEIELQRPERCDPRRELLDELDGLVGMCANQRLPRARVCDADGEVQAGRNPAEGHLAGDAHRLVARSNIQSRWSRPTSRRSPYAPLRNSGVQAAEPQ